MIPEREREALMRLTMCAREECGTCKYTYTCNFDFQYETATRCMNILADALRKTESNSEKPNNCEDEPQVVDWGKRKPCTLELFDDDGNYIEPKDEPQTERKCVNCKFLTYMFGKTWCNIKCDNPHDKVCDRWQANEPQTDCQWK